MRAQWSEACEEAREMLGVFLCVCVCARARVRASKSACTCVYALAREARREKLGGRRDGRAMRERLAPVPMHTVCVYSLLVQA